MSNLPIENNKSNKDTSITISNYYKHNTHNVIRLYSQDDCQCYDRQYRQLKKTIIDNICLLTKNLIDNDPRPITKKTTNYIFNRPIKLSLSNQYIDGLTYYVKNIHNHNHSQCGNDTKHNSDCVVYCFIVRKENTDRDILEIENIYDNKEFFIENLILIENYLIGETT